MRKFADLKDPTGLGLSPLESLDLDKISSFDDLLSAMSKTSFSGRSLGEALDVLEEMVRDQDCLVVGTFSGAMTVARMGKIMCKMIDEGWLDVIISTGALMAHGFVESIGLDHYKYDSSMCDRELFRRGLNRVYDTLEPETNLNHAEDIIHRVMEEVQPGEVLSSEIICKKIGRYLAENVQGPGILKSAYDNGVSVYIPAFTDSELALDIATHMIKKKGLKEATSQHLDYSFNPFLDLLSYTNKIIEAEKIGIFTIGGGVPRNWAQQVGPFMEVAGQRLDLDLPDRKFQYGIRICPDPVHWGGLSGCTYQEGTSWGKFVPESEGGKYAEVYSDATIAWPLLVMGLVDRLENLKH